VTGTTTQVGFIIIIIIIIINPVQFHRAVLKYSCVTMTRYSNVRIFLVHCILFVVESKSVSWKRPASGSVHE